MTQRFTPPPSPPARSRDLRRLVLTAAAVLALAPAAAAQPRSEKEAIRKVLDDQVAAWNKGDLKAFMAGYWSSPELTFFAAGKRTRGWQAALDRYVERYQGKGREMGQLTFSELDVEVLGPDSALVRGRWQLKRSKDNPGGLFTLVFRRLPEGWRIIHDHTSADER